MGALPLPGWDEKNGWEKDPVPFERMPRLFNPETGFIATANNRPAPEKEMPYLGEDWLDGYRFERLVELLAERRDWDAESTMKLQMDDFSIPWRSLRDVVLSIPASGPEEKLALSILGGWDGDVSADSAAAAVFEFFLYRMLSRITESKAPRASEWMLAKGFNPFVPHSGFLWALIGHTVRLIREQPEGWFTPRLPHIRQALHPAKASRTAIPSEDNSEPTGKEPSESAYNEQRIRLSEWQREIALALSESVSELVLTPV